MRQTVIGSSDIWGDVEGVLWVDLDRSRNGLLLDDHGECGGEAHSAR